MKLTHHFSTQDPAAFRERLIAIHRKCLLQLQAQNSKAAVPSAPGLQQNG